MILPVRMDIDALFGAAARARSDPLQLRQTKRPADPGNEFNRGRTRREDMRIVRRKGKGISGEEDQPRHPTDP